MVAFRNLPERERMERRLGHMKIERAPFDPTYRDLAQMLAPANGRFFMEKPNRNTRDWSHIVDSTGPEAVETSVAGIMSIASSPAQKWHGFTTSDPELDDSYAVKTWLHEARDVVLDIIDHSNSYTALPHYYREMLVFATAAGLILPHDRNVICHYPLTCGEYYLQHDEKGEVNVLFREYHMTTGMLVKRFGKENCSKLVRTQFENGDLDFHHHVAQCIEPREDVDPDRFLTEPQRGNERVAGRVDKRNKRWRSVYWEMGDRGPQVLEESGYDDFPVVAPRWDTAGGDVYGTGPGNRALPHCQRLQIMTKRLARGVHAQMEPAGQFPNSMKNREIETQPNGKNYYDASTAQGGARALFDIRPQLDHMLLHLQDIRAQVNQAYYANFFAKVSNDERNDRATAAEIHAIKEEAWLMLGPFAQRVFRELLAPMVQTTFLEAMRNNVLPPIPPELSGRTIGVKFTSVLAQAQESVGAVAMDRFTFQLGQIFAIKPSVLDSFNEREWAERYAQKLGVDPQLIVPGEQVALLQQSRAQAEAAQMQSEMLPNYAKSAKDAADAQRQLASAGAA